ncbi:hypothetical protein ACOME3_006641 [Neoechinorhynchus agilis]
MDDDLFCFKCLKRAALGRMCTMIRRHNSTFEYLEQVRQHLSRLPSIDPSTRTLIICGFPNVGKSSFLNKITNAGVEVQPYAFTTKSLYVGHTDYNFLRWQVIDTPGILDHELEQRNTIEMQAITALAHLKACVIFLVDISEDCGFSLGQQIDLFKNIRILFQDKPLLVVASKSDLVKLNDLPEESRIGLEDLTNSEIPLVQMSVSNEEGVIEVRNKACDLLLNHRLEQKANSKLVKKLEARLKVTMPKPRDSKERPYFIPNGAIEYRENVLPNEKPRVSSSGQKFEKDLEDELGKDYHVKQVTETKKFKVKKNAKFRLSAADLRKNWLLENDDEKYDIIPEIWNGHNISDILDVDLDQRLKELEEEEALLESMGFYDLKDEQDDYETQRLRGLGRRIRNKRLLMMQESRLNSQKKRKLPVRAKKRRRSEFLERMDEIGIEPTADKNNEKMESRLVAKKAHRTTSESSQKRKLTLVPKVPRNELGLKNKATFMKLEKMRRKDQAMFSRKGRVCESDRRIPTKKPKHLFSGKRKLGKTQRR